MYYYIEQYRVSDSMISGRDDVTRFADDEQKRGEEERAISKASPLQFRTRQVQSEKQLPTFPPIELAPMKSFNSLYINKYIGEQAVD